MKNKRVLAALLVAAMTLGLTACGGSDNGSVNGTESGSSKADGNYDQVTYAYCTFNNIPTEEDLDVVAEGINKIRGGGTLKALIFPVHNAKLNRST